MKKIFWIDLEMTGLDWQKEVIIEAAAIVTDLRFNELATYHSVVHQEQKYLDGMDSWNSKTHGESGLTAKVPQGKDPAVVEQDLIDLAHQHFAEDKVIIAGNTIHQDRLFLNHYMKEFAQRLHYRMLDVTSWKLIFNTLYDKSFAKSNSHRALDDIRESIAELKFYLSSIKN